MTNTAAEQAVITALFNDPSLDAEQVAHRIRRNRRV